MSKREMSILGTLINAKLADNGQMEEMGVVVGRLYTDHGLPIDMALDRLSIIKQQKVVIVDGVCQWLITHKRNSGATEKSIDRQRQTNRKILDDFIRTGEVGIY